MRKLARRMWTLYEPIHGIVYFTEECRAAAAAAGYRGFWMGYFALRSAPLGRVGPEVAGAAFYGFHLSRVTRALPDAWAIADPDTALAARLAGAGAALQRLWGPRLHSSQLRAAADILWEASQATDTAGRVLAAANRALPRPGPAHLALWQAATTLREHRGDGHNACLVTYGVDPAQAHLLKIAAGETDPTAPREGRNWPTEQWES